MLRCLLLLAMLFSLTGCAMLGGYGYAQGEVAGEEVAARLDSPLAQAYLQPQEADPELRARIRAIEAAYPGVPDAAQLAALTAATSPDFASLLYARRLLQQPRNRVAQQRSHQLAQGLSLAGLDARSARLFATHHALVVPGWFWESRSETGADLAFPRRFLAGLGLRSTLVETNEHGTVEANAGIIAQAVRKARELERPVVLTIPPGTQGGKTFRLRKLGMPQLKNPDQRGDLLAEVEISVPTELSEREQELFEELRSLRG